MSSDTTKNKSRNIQINIKSVCDSDSENMFGEITKKNNKKQIKIGHTWAGKDLHLPSIENLNSGLKNLDLK